MKNKLVSIIIPVHNKINRVEESINSCISQTYKNIEVIVVDDYSTDGSYERIVEISKKNKRIKVFRNTSNLGAPFSRNFGIDNAKGDFINFLDVDDGFFPTKIERQIKKIESVNKKVGVVTCDILFKSEIIGDELIKNRQKGDIYIKMLKNYVVFGTGTMLIKAGLLKKVKFDKRFASNQEYDLMIQLSRITEFDFIPETLCYENRDDCGISYNFKKKISGTLMLFRKYHNNFKKAGINIVFYNYLRFSYLMIRYTFGFVFGKNIYRKFFR